MELNDKIRNRRLRLGLSLEDVGKAVGVSKGTVFKWENGDIANMRRDKIAKLAKALKTTPAYLMDWDDSAFNAAYANTLFFETIYAIPLIRDLEKCCNYFDKPFEPIVSHYFSEDYFSSLIYLIEFSSLKGNDKLFYENHFNCGSLEQVFLQVLNKPLSDSLTCFSREEINLILTFRMLPDNQKDAIRLLCGLNNSSSKSNTPLPKSTKKSTSLPLAARGAGDTAIDIPATLTLADEAVADESASESK